MIFSEMYYKNVTEIELHEYSALHPKMDTDQFDGLKQSLMDDGQTYPVVLYRGKLVDGRHRVWALLNNKELLVECVDLPRNTKLKEVKKFVMRSEKRRHQSKNQLLCAAYLDFINPKSEAKTLSQLALDYGVSQAGLSQTKKVAEEHTINVIHSFINGEKVNLCVNGTFSNYATIASIYSAMKRVKIEGWAKSQRQAAIGFDEFSERSRLRAFCTNDSLDLLKFKQKEVLDLILEKENNANKLTEEFN